MNIILILQKTELKQKLGGRPMKQATAFKPRMYISGKISDNANAEEDFKRGVMWAKGKGYHAINPYTIGMELAETFTHEEFMKIDFQLIEICDAIYMLRGWQNSKGAVMELQHAIAFDKSIFYEEEADRWEVEKF
jgi:hypothetical protein